MQQILSVNGLVQVLTGEVFRPIRGSKVFDAPSGIHIPMGQGQRWPGMLETKQWSCRGLELSCRLKE